MKKSSLGVLNVLLQLGYTTPLLLYMKGVGAQQAVFTLGEEVREEGGTQEGIKKNLVFRSLGNQFWSYFWRTGPRRSSDLYGS